MYLIDIGNDSSAKQVYTVNMNRQEQGVRKVQYTTQSDYVSDHGGRGRGLVDLDEANVLDLFVYPDPCRALTHDIYHSARPAPAPLDGPDLDVGLYRLLSVPFAAAT
jgi:hypothetical protein